MKTIFVCLFFGMLSISTLKACSAQVPQWVADVSEAVFPFEIAQISHWEEKQKTWFHINDALDNSDSISVNTLFVKGTTSAGHFFIGSIPIQNNTFRALGSSGTKGETCTGECGCQQCRFKRDDYGCEDCGDCVKQDGCQCWCKHALVRDKAGK